MNQINNFLFWNNLFMWRIAAFQKKLDAVNISVVYDARSVKDGSFKGPGYHHPERHYADKSEHSGYHVMFCYPSVRHSIYYWLRLYSSLSFPYFICYCTMEDWDDITKHNGWDMVSMVIWRIGGHIAVTKIEWFNDNSSPRLSWFQ